MVGRLLCAFDRHTPSPEGLWNGGYCFTRCRRCGRDMVRSAFGEWHIPHAYRVVWRPPGDGPAHQLPGVAPPPPPREPRVVRDQRPAPLPPPLPPPPVRARRNGNPFDFADLDHDYGTRGWRTSRHAAR